MIDYKIYGKKLKLNYTIKYCFMNEENENCFQFKRKRIFLENFK